MTVETHEQTLSDEAREKLREAVNQIQDATLDLLLKKPVRETSFFVHVQGDDGKPKPVRVRYRALPPKALDKLVQAYPPSPKEAKAGAQWNEQFPAALISAVSLAPRMTADQAAELLESDSWSLGETNALFNNAWSVCSAGFDVPFSAGD